jgi:hypothetical protein
MGRRQPVYHYPCAKQGYEGSTMNLNAYELSAGIFIRGLTNLKAMLAEAEAHAAATGSDETTLLATRIAAASGLAHEAPRDLHNYTLAAQVHWAAEGANLAVARLLGAPRKPASSVARSFAELHQHLDATIEYLRGIAPADLEPCLDRPIVFEHPRGSVSSHGGQFLVAYAIPHFYYHVTTAYGILRNQGVKLTMGDFLGNWGTANQI